MGAAGRSSCAARATAECSERCSSSPSRRRWVNEARAWVGADPRRGREAFEFPCGSLEPHLQRSQIMSVTETKAEAPVAPKPRLLVIDDEISLGQSLSRVFARRGYEVHVE